jgi:hypothetical protein
MTVRRAAIELTLYGDPSTLVGLALESTAHSVQVDADAEVRGVVLELSGPALALLDVERMDGWNARRTPPAGEWSVAPSPRGADLVFAFPDAAPRPTSFFGARLQARGRKEGRAKLIVRARAGAGDAVVKETEVVVEAAPRWPILPELGEARRLTPHDARFAKSYNRRDFAVGWLAFDAEFASVRETFVALAEEAAAAVLAATGASSLRVSLRRGDSFPTALLDVGGAGGGGFFRRALGRGADPWKPIWELLEVEGIAELRAADGDTGTLKLAHQPRGPTVMPIGQRTGPAAVPLEMGWSVARPESADARRAFAAFMDRAVRTAATRAEAIGALATAQGASFDPPYDPLPYEVLARLHGACSGRAWAREHVRSPAWRVLVPSGARARVPRAERDGEAQGYRVDEVRAGWLVSAAADDPFSLKRTDLEPIERLLVGVAGASGALGDATEFDEFRARNEPRDPFDVAALSLSAAPAASRRRTAASAGRYPPDPNLGGASAWGLVAEAWDSPPAWFAGIPDTDLQPSLLGAVLHGVEQGVYRSLREGAGPRADLRAAALAGLERARDALHVLLDGEKKVLYAGSAAVAAVFVASEREAVIGWIGNARAVLVGKEVRALTTDHDLRSDYAKTMPQMAKEEIESLPDVITRALGMRRGDGQPVAIDVVRCSLEPGDALMLLSPGLARAVDLTALREAIVVKEGAHAVASELVVRGAAALPGQAMGAVVLRRR